MRNSMGWHYTMDICDGDMISRWVGVFSGTIVQPIATSSPLSYQRVIERVIIDREWREGTERWKREGKKLGVIVEWTSISPLSLLSSRLVPWFRDSIMMSLPPFFSSKCFKFYLIFPIGIRLPMLSSQLSISIDYCNRSISIDNGRSWTPLRPPLPIFLCSFWPMPLCRITHRLSLPHLSTWIKSVCDWGRDTVDQIDWGYGRLRYQGVPFETLKTQVETIQADVRSIRESIEELKEMKREERREVRSGISRNSACAMYICRYGVGAFHYKKSVWTSRPKFFNC